MARQTGQIRQRNAAIKAHGGNGNTFKPDRWRRCLDCGCSVPRGEPHPCFRRGAFAAYIVGFLGALAFGIGAACLAAEMFK